MMHRTLSVIIFVLLACATCYGQTSYKGLTPGKSTRADVQRVLGLPVKKVSETLVEYRPQPLTGKIFVQYRKGSPVVERIEVSCRLQNSSCNDFARSLNLRLPENPETAKVPETAEKNLFYYGPPLYVVTTMDVESFANNEIVPFRIAFYSRELYEAAAGGVKATNDAELAKAEEESRRGCGKGRGGVGALNHHSSAARMLQVSQFEGCVSVQRSDGQGPPSPAATIDIYRTDLSGSYSSKTDRSGRFFFAGLPISGTYLLVVSGPGLKWSYVNGVRLPQTSVLEMVAEPGDGVRPTREQVMAAIR